MSEGVGGNFLGNWVAITVKGLLQHSDDARFYF